MNTFPLFGTDSFYFGFICWEDNGIDLNICDESLLLTTLGNMKFRAWQGVLC